MSELVEIKGELEHDDFDYKKSMYEKERKVQRTLNMKVKEKNAFSDKIYNETILNNSSN